MKFSWVTGSTAIAGVLAFAPCGFAQLIFDGGSTTVTTADLDPDTNLLLGFDDNTLEGNDDSFTDAVPLGFTANFFGTSYDEVYVNNNGNITFDSALSTFTPFDLTATATPIIAPFFADVDTSGDDINDVTYGQGTVDGRDAFGVNYINVGYFSSNNDLLNTFQVVLVDRSDVGEGDFDFIFNYDQIEWETGDASDGENGVGGSSARAGFSNGSGDDGTYFEIDGSAVNGAFLDGGSESLAARDTITFEVRNGGVSSEDVDIPEIPVDDPIDETPTSTVPTPSAVAMGLLILGGLSARRRQA